MNKLSFISVLVLVFVFINSLSFAQLRENQFKSSDYQNGIIKVHDQEPGNWSNLFNMTMDHSYSMMFGSIGGEYQNLNAYTNTMHFFFSDKMTGRLDLSVLHSPFGNSYLNNGAGNQNVDFIIRNAEVNYQLSEKSNITFRFQQIPSYGYGNGYGYYNRRSPFSNHPFYGTNY